MKLNETDTQILRHIVNYCDEIETTVKTFGQDEKIFKGNFIYRNAVSMPILQIGELANHLSDEFVSTYAEIPWRSIVGMRNRFAHGYQVMDLAEIWHTATNDIPMLNSYCKKLLSTES